jgi:L-threonylcarbamoyladenylate synthase
MVWEDENLIRVLRGNGIVVMPTDTLYGIVARAQDKPAVNRIYALRKRNPQKPCIILIGDIGELEKFSIILSEEQRIVIQKYWSFESAKDPTSIILDCTSDSLSYLHRGTKTLAFRIPQSSELRDLLMKVGPLVAPSANPEGLSPAQNITEAKKYFGDLLDLYLDGGTIAGKASKVIKLHKDGTVSILRE